MANRVFPKSTSAFVFPTLPPISGANCLVLFISNKSVYFHSCLCLISVCVLREQSKYEYENKHQMVRPTWLAGTTGAMGICKQPNSKKVEALSDDAALINRTRRKIHTPPTETGEAQTDGHTHTNTRIPSWQFVRTLFPANELADQKHQLQPTCATPVKCIHYK